MNRIIIINDDNHPLRVYRILPCLRPETSLMSMNDIIVSIQKEMPGIEIETSQLILNAYETGVYPESSKVIAVARPANKEQIQQCIKLANQYKVPVYPVSKGCNWGYGSKVPVKTGSLVLDLGKMNTILDYNEDLGYVTVEPGVTLGQLNNFLREKKSKLIMSTTGGSIDSSLVGNTMERGIATGPYAERLSHVCGFEVVLPDGKIIRTGFRRFGEDVSSKVFKWGIGPYVDGIFTQSNLGIVTSMTMWLMPAPEYMSIVYYEADDSKKYYKLIDELYNMVASGLVRPTLTMYNNFRVLSTLRQYPWDNDTELSTLSGWQKINKVLEYANNNMNIKLWTGEVCIRAISKEHADIQANAIQERIKPYTQDSFVVTLSKEEMMHIMDGTVKLSFNTPQEVLKNYLAGKYLGLPNNVPVQQCYWRKKTPVPSVMDPDMDKCGMIWICPIVPFKGSYTQQAIDIIGNVTAKYDYEPAISMQCMTERSIHIIASIAWDREVAGEDEKALQYYQELKAELFKNGFYFYRDTTHGMTHSLWPVNDYDHFLGSIKKAIDPNNILAPGRYIKDGLN